MNKKVQGLYRTLELDGEHAKQIAGRVLDMQGRLVNLAMRSEMKGDVPTWLVEELHSLAQFLECEQDLRPGPHLVVDLAWQRMVILAREMGYRLDSVHMMRRSADIEFRWWSPDGHALPHLWPSISVGVLGEVAWLSGAGTEREALRQAIIKALGV